jgi:hypothetical protein
VTQRVAGDAGRFLRIRQHQGVGCGEQQVDVRGLSRDLPRGALHNVHMRCRGRAQPRGHRPPPGRCEPALGRLL